MTKKDIFSTEKSLLSKKGQPNEKREDFKNIIGNLNYIRDIESIKNYDKENLYTSHGLNHTINILEYINNIINYKSFAVADTTLFFLTFAVLYHDIGMRKGRENHAKNSSKLLPEIFKNQNILDTRDIETIGNIIKSHSLSKNSNELKEILKDNDRCSEMEIAVCLLRFADILDFSKDRLYTEELSDVSFSSYLHWRKHKLILKINFNKRKNVIIVEPNSKLIKSAWDIYFIEKEFSYIKSEFEFCKQLIGRTFIDNCYENVVLSNQFIKRKKEIYKNLAPLKLKPYVQFMENEYNNLYGRDDDTLNVIWNIFSNYNATVLYGVKGVGKSSLVKCKIRTALSSFEKDSIETIYIEDYENIEIVLPSIINKDKNKKIIIFDQFEKAIIIGNKLRIITELMSKNNNCRFLFCILPEQLTELINLFSKIENFKYKVCSVKDISVIDAFEYISKALNIKSSVTRKEVKKYIDYFKVISNENISFNNLLNIFFSSDYFSKTKYKSFEISLSSDKNIFINIIQKYHDSLFNYLTQNQKVILNRFLTRNNNIKASTLDEESDLTLLSNKNILRCINNKRYEFIHSQLLKVYRENYCEDKELVMTLNLEEEFESLYSRNKSASNDSLQSLLSLNKALFGNNEKDYSLKKFVIKILIKENLFNNKIKAIYNVKSDLFLCIACELIDEITCQKEIKDAFLKYKNLFRINFPIEKIKYQNDKVEYSDIMNAIFQLDLSGIKPYFQIEKDFDKELLFITDEVKDEIIELIYLNIIHKKIVNKEKDSKVEIIDYRDKLKNKRIKYLSIICNDIPNLSRLIVCYFMKLYTKNAFKAEVSDNNELILENGRILEFNRKDLLYCCFRTKPIKVFLENNNRILGISSEDKTIKYFTENALLKLLLDIKLYYKSKKKFLIAPFEKNIFNTENSNSISTLISDIISIEEGTGKNYKEIIVSKPSLKLQIFNIDIDGKYRFFYHNSYDFYATSSITNIDITSIKPNSNNSNIAIAIIGQKDEKFEEKYKNITSFYIYFDDRIAMVSKAIDAWCYEIIKLKALIEENKGIIKYIYLIKPENQSDIQEKTIRFLLDKDKNNLVFNDADFKELNLFCEPSIWNKIFDGVEIIDTTKSNFDKKLYRIFSFKEKSNLVINKIQKASINKIKLPVEFIAEDKAEEPFKIATKSFADAYIDTIKRIHSYGTNINDSSIKELIGLTIEIENPLNTLNDYLRSDIEFYRKNEIESYYEKQWCHVDGRIYKYIHSVFGVNQTDILIDLIGGSIQNKKITRKGVMTFHFPDISRLDKIDSLFSCFVHMEIIGKNKFSINPYFVWRSNECVFGLLLSLVNSIRWFNEYIIKVLASRFPEVEIIISKYYYHGINMHIDSNSITKRMIKTLINEYEKNSLKWHKNQKSVSS